MTSPLANGATSQRPDGSPQEIIDMPEEDLLAFLAQKQGTADLSKTSELLRKAARDSYRLTSAFEPLNISLASSFNCIQAYQKEIRLIEQAIDKCIKGMNTNALIILQSIPADECQKSAICLSDVLPNSW